MKVRLKLGCNKREMNTPYGVIRHDWVSVPDDVYIYNELEIFGEEQKPVEVIAPSPASSIPSKKKHK